MEMLILPRLMGPRQDMIMLHKKNDEEMSHWVGFRHQPAQRWFYFKKFWMLYTLPETNSKRSEHGCLEHEDDPLNLGKNNSDPMDENSLKNTTVVCKKLWWRLSRIQCLAFLPTFGWFSWYFLVNVGRYTIHGWYGLGRSWMIRFGWFYDLSCTHQ